MPDYMVSLPRRLQALSSYKTVQIFLVQVPSVLSVPLMYTIISQ